MIFIKESVHYRNNQITPAYTMQTVNLNMSNKRATTRSFLLFTV